MQIVLLLRFDVQYAAVLAQRAQWNVVPLLGLLALLGTTVLEPDLHLSLGQGQGLGQFRFPPDRNVPGCVVLLLQLQPLVVRVDDAVLVLGSRLA